MAVFCSLYGGSTFANNFEFNLELVDIADRKNIDFSQFRTAGYIYPGIYQMQLRVNEREAGEFEIEYLESEDGGSEVCITNELVQAIGLKDEYLERVLKREPVKGCYDLSELPGIVKAASLQTYSLSLAVPQAYVINAPDGWDLPSNWDYGVNGVLLDYGLNLRQNYNHSYGDSTDFSAYGVAGLNLGAWRWRADWRGEYTTGQQGLNRSDFQINRVYGYRAIPELTAKLSVGEIDLGTTILDSFQFAGMTLATDEAQLPPNLRGYAPEVAGIAKTNAKVVISQHGRTLYETQVASGPFRIQDLNQSLNGTLDVRVEEQDGTVQTFQVNTASIPYLSRPGSIRYKVGLGKATSSYRDHKLDGPEFVSGEVSWGISNAWSVFGGGLLSDGYGSVVLGMGRDLFDWGAISFDITRAWADVPEKGSKSGNSYRVNYSKHFTDYDSQVTFAAYRFSERDFLTMSDYLSLLNNPDRFDSYSGSSKELYSIILSKQFRDLNIGAYLDFSHQSYWDQADRERISLSASSSFDFFDWKGISLALSAYRSEQAGIVDNGMYLSLSTSLGQNGRANYSVSQNGANTTHSMGYYDRLDDRNSYSLTAGASSQGNNRLSGFYTHTGDNALISANFTHNPGDSTNLGLSMTGGVTATFDGSAALHRASATGGSRIMVDTDGAENVPLKGAGPAVKTNIHGKAVLADISSYYRQSISIDINELGSNVEHIGSPVRTGTLTEGSIGYRHFDMLTGAKRMSQISLGDGRFAPFAALVYNSKQQQVGMITDEGLAYLIGLNQGEILSVTWGTNTCQMLVPELHQNETEMLMLSCR